MSIFKTRKHSKELQLNGNEKKELKEPKSWTIINALSRVLELSEDSQLSEEFWESAKKPLAYLRKKLGLTNVQIVVIAIMIEDGGNVTWKGLGDFLRCSRLSMMVYSEEIEELVAKRWICRRSVREFGGTSNGYGLVDGVITALRHNKVFVPEKIDGLTEQQFVDKLEKHLDKRLDNVNMDFEAEESWMLQLAKANPDLPLCEMVLKFKDVHTQSLLLLIVYDYAQWADSEDEGMTFGTVNDLYPEDWDCDEMRRNLISGEHELIHHGYIEFACEDGVVNNERYRLTKRAKELLLSAYTPSKSKADCHYGTSNRFMKSHTLIKEKTLFFNASEQEQIQRLTSLLSAENLPSVQKRLEEQGLRKGFACLFYGSPGTGKTESVLQIARQTGRDLMQVDIAGLRDKWVGESEKNIKEVFSRYRRLCKNSEVMPILFFNEADAIINKRTENIERSIDKMDNAMQNIILQEIENLDGILIATTNLTSNLDKAFERRFIFKVEFHKPATEVKEKIWTSMLKDISSEDAHKLASRFDFSGGQIENIARKRTIDYILTGKYASFDEIEGYCRAELLTNTKERKHIAGFSA